MDITRPGTAGELLRQSVVPPQGLQPSQAQTGQVLDYAKIKADLTTATDRMRALLLQALRWVGIQAFSFQYTNNMQTSIADVAFTAIFLNYKVMGVFFCCFQKLTKSAPPERDTMLQAFIQHDILGCSTSGAYRVHVEHSIGLHECLS